MRFRPLLHAPDEQQRPPPRPRHRVHRRRRQAAPVLIPPTPVAEEQTQLGRELHAAPDEHGPATETAHMEALVTNTLRIYSDFYTAVECTRTYVRGTGASMLRVCCRRSTGRAEPFDGRSVTVLGCAGQRQALGGGALCC